MFFGWLSDNGNGGIYSDLGDQRQIQIEIFQGIDRFFISSYPGKNCLNVHRVESQMFNEMLCHFFVVKEIGDVVFGIVGEKMFFVV